MLERTWKHRISRLSITATALALFTLLPGLSASTVEAASLTPTRPALLNQVHQARSHGYSYAAGSADVSRLLQDGELVPLPGNRSYVVKHTVKLPYARPEVKLFVERLASQYRAACGEKLVVTSLIRPKSQQPRNSSPLSVHPTGMALDLRVSANRRCRSWLESALLGLEASGTLEAARERRPPHYHVVVFPKPYARYVAAKTGQTPVAVKAAAHGVSVKTYKVRRGDNLWKIARTHNTTVRDIQRANNLRSTRIKPSQVLKVPVRAR